MKLYEHLLNNKKEGKATLAANFYNFETLSAVLTAAKKLNSPIILQLSESSIRYMGLKVAKGLADKAIEQYGVTAWLHMDHGSDVDLVKECIDCGFDSVMIDASEKPIGDNVRITSDIVDYARSYDINVEAELGYIAKLGQGQKMVYTQPDEAKNFVEQTGINALAIAVGSAHGFYKETPQLQLDLIEQINAATPAALVLHGSSGIPHDQLQRAISRGITKINLATEIKNIFMKTLQKVLQETDEIDLRVVFPKATEKATELVSEKLRVINLEKIIKTALSVIIFFTSGSLFAQNPENLLLKDFKPVSIYNTPKTEVKKAAYPVIDMHSHDYASSPDEVENWVKTMKEKGIEKTILLTGATGVKFDSLVSVYSKYGNKFDLWCGFDYSGYKEPGWTKKAIKELERCKNAGAKGIGELGDKGLGLKNSFPIPAWGMHFDDKRMQPLLKRCGELGMPINVHIAEPYWMYLDMDGTNDGLMNAYNWEIDKSKEGILLHQELIQTLENSVSNNPQTTFIACHVANCSHDLEILGKLLDTYKNLYADIAARYAEFSPTPRRTEAFFTKYQDRIIYGTDMGMDADMYETTFRILESGDEHFYENDLFGYHWPLYGLSLSNEVLSKIYYGNATKILEAK